MNERAKRPITSAAYFRLTTVPKQKHRDASELIADKKKWAETMRKLRSVAIPSFYRGLQMSAAGDVPGPHESVVSLLKDGQPFFLPKEMRLMASDTPKEFKCFAEAVIAFAKQEGASMDMCAKCKREIPIVLERQRTLKGEVADIRTVTCPFCLNSRNLLKQTSRVLAPWRAGEIS